MQYVVHNIAPARQAQVLATSSAECRVSSAWIPLLRHAMESPGGLQERSIAAAATHLRSSWVALLARHLSVLTHPLPEHEKLPEAAPVPSLGGPQPAQLRAAAAAVPAGTVRREGGTGESMTTALQGEGNRVLADEYWQGGSACAWGCCEGADPAHVALCS